MPNKEKHIEKAHSYLQMALEEIMLAKENDKAKSKQSKPKFDKIISEALEKRRSVRFKKPNQ